MPLPRSLLPALLACASLLATASLNAQTAPASATAAAAGKDAALTLSPFTVNATSDVGYLAGNTLAGSRLNTSLKDTAASISVFTEELISDLGATDLTALTNYANNVELELGDSQNNAAPNGNNLLEFYQTYRVRGLPASVARNYFNWKLPTDVYNIARVEDSRGPNAVLFGVGSAGGVLNSSTKQALLGKTFFHFATSAASYDSYRATLDLNEAAADGKFGVRLNAVDDRTNGYREYAFAETKRLHLAAKYELSRQTTVRAELERGTINDNVARTYNLTNGGSAWITGGRPTFAAPVATNAGQGLLRQSTATREVYTQNSDSLMNWANTMSTSGSSAVITDPAQTNDTINTSGPGALRKSQFKTASAFLEQRIGEKTYLELAFNHQDYAYDGYDPTVNSTNLGGDPNQKLPNGAANPYSGRLLLESTWFRRVRFEQSNTFRLMFSTEADAGPWGDYRFALLGEHERRLYKSNEYGEAWQGNPFNALPENAANLVIRRNYVTEGDWSSYFINGANQFGLINNKLDPVTGKTLSSTWVTRTNSLEDSPSTQNSILLGLQARYFGGRLIAGVGLRHDHVRTDEPTVVRDPVTNAWMTDDSHTTSSSFTGDTRSLGIVGHVTRNFSLLADYSTNVDLPNPRITIVPGVHTGAPTGKGSDVGFSFTALDGKIYAKAVYYKTDSKHQADFRLQEVNNTSRDILDGLLAAKAITQADHDAHVVTNSGATFDRRSNGYEFQLVGNPTPNWRLLANFSIANATEDNIAPEVKAWAATALPYWASFNQNLAAAGSGTIATRTANLEDVMDALFETEGAGQLGNRKYKVNAFTRYSFSRGFLRGLYVGAGYRHQSKMLIGRDTTTGEKQYGNSFWYADGLAGYTFQGLPKNRSISLQLNVSNVFDDTDPLIVRTQGAAQIRRWILVTPRTWRLTANFGF